MGFIMKLVLSRSIAVACYLRRFNGIQFCKQESSPITLKMLTVDLSIKKVLPYSDCVLNAWVWQRRDCGGMECHILHHVFAVSFHMLFRDSWQQTSSGYEEKSYISSPKKLWNLSHFMYSLSSHLGSLFWSAWDSPAGILLFKAYLKMEVFS